jgi:small subunit ribosomal protein S16
MVSIRLSRSGAKKRPFYHIVVTDSRNRSGGRFIERLGFFNPVASGKDESLRLDFVRAKYWLSTGAQPSERVAKLIKEYAKTAPVEETTAVEAMSTQSTSAESVSTDNATAEAVPPTTSTEEAAPSAEQAPTEAAPPAENTSTEATPPLKPENQPTAS